MGVANTVYLSKSNHANPDHVMKVRQWLDGKGFTIVEHQGGTYDPTLLQKAEIMVMVGCTEINHGHTSVGKGQYDQLKHRRILGLTKNYYVTGQYYGNAVLRQVALDGIIDENNWTHNYGRLKIKMESTMKINTVFPHGPTTSDQIPHMVDGGQDMLKQADTCIDVRPSQAPIEVHLACIKLFY